MTGMRTVIAEDSVLLRDGLSRILSSVGFDVVAAVGDADALVTAMDGLGPELAVIDVRMPPSHTDEGLRAALVIRRQWPDVAVVMLSQYAEERYASELLGAGTRGVGYLLKDRVAEVGEFVETLGRVAAGGTVLDPEVIAQLLPRARADPLRRLTRRERDVLALMAEGHSNGAIARRLVVSESAVAKHINNIFAKLDLPPAEDVHRRVLAVLTFLRGAGGPLRFDDQ